MKKLLLGLLVLGSTSSFANSNCSTVAEKVSIATENIFTDKQLSVLSTNEINSLVPNKQSIDYQVILIDRENTSLHGDRVLAPIVSYKITTTDSCNFIGSIREFDSKIEVNI